MRYNQITENKKGYTGFVLDHVSRQSLLTKFPPKFPNVIAEHVTYKFGVDESAVPPAPKTAEIVGYAYDDSLEAYVVSIDGSIHRPDGKIFHITWSLDKSKGRKPVQSNTVIESGWEKINPISITLIPKFFSF